MKNNVACLQTGMCTGCSACVSVCPVGCIVMEKNKEGFWNSKVNDSLCISCGKCAICCPQMKPLEFPNREVRVYCARLKEEKMLRQSSSGGAFAALAETILDENGIVYGVALVKGNLVRHIRVDTLKQLEKLKGSKYTQSDLGNSIIQVKQDLHQGKKVLFSGTPCQIAGIVRAVGNNTANLYTVDLICHGVPSSQLFKAEIDILEMKVGCPVKNYTFRDKSDNPQKLHWKAEFENGKVQCGYPFQNAYFSAFQRGTTFNEACYQCFYARKERISDITIGDFWSAEVRLNEFYNPLGNSAIMLSTKKGESLFERAKKKLVCVESDFETLAIDNPNLKKPHSRPEIRDIVYRQISAESPQMVVKNISTFSIRLKQMLGYICPHWLKVKLKEYLYSKAEYSKYGEQV